MKKMMTFIALILLGIVCIVSKSMAQEQKNIISINPFGIALGIENIEFEKVLNGHSSMAVYLGRSGFAPAKISDVTFQGSEERITYRYYLGNAPKEMWSGVSLAYSSGRAEKDVSGWKDDWSVENISMIALSIESGYRWTLGNFNIAPIVMYRFPLTDNLLGTKIEFGNAGKTPLVGLGLGLNIGWEW